MTIHTIRLEGVRSRPLGGYLKALGIFRLVAEQREPSARAFWDRGVFILRSALDSEALAEFFLREYVPTPVTNPWNGDAGFRLKKRPGAALQVEAVEASTALRFEPYRRALAVVREELARYEGQGLDSFKEELKVSLRSRLPEEALAWYDAVLVLGEDRFGYAPLFGSGGNDGSQDFSKGFLQALEAMIDLASGAPTRFSEKLLQAALCGHAVDRLSTDTAGQYAPVSTGGVNASAGMSGPSLTNPWDIILLLEGAMMFAASATRKLDGDGVSRTTFPFTVRAISTGYASASDKDTGGRAFEMWLPLWRSPASLHEISALMREGRVTQGRRRVRNATDFALALGRLGVDRGIASFERFGVYERNGNNYYATPLGEWRVPREPRQGVSSLDDKLLGWIDDLRRVSGDKAPGSLQRARRAVDRALLEFARQDDGRRLLALLAAVGRAEIVVRRVGRTEELRPVPLVRAGIVEAVLGEQWDCPHRLAASLAAVDLRLRRSGVLLTKNDQTAWARSDDPGVAWTSSSVESGLIEVVLRRGLEDQQATRSAESMQDGRTAGEQRPVTNKTRTAFSARAWKSCAPLPDVAAFLSDQVDRTALEEALDAFALVEPLEIPFPRLPDRGAPALFALMAPVVHRRLGVPPRAPFGPKPRVGLLHATPGVIERAVSGDSLAASKLCHRRLRSAGVKLHIVPFEARARVARMCARALAFPLSDAALGALVEQVGEHPSVDNIHELESA